MKTILKLFIFSIFIIACNQSNQKVSDKKEETVLTNELFGELEALLKVFPDFDFGNLEPIDFTYKSIIIEDQFETITIAGIKVEAPVTLAGEFVNASDVINRITKVFIEQGFIHDEFNDSGNCSFYTNENMVIQICNTAGDNELLTDEIKIVIKFGFI